MNTKKKILITGSSGFIGQHLINYLSNSFTITKYSRQTKLKINHNIVIHLAGIAHDLSGSYSYANYLSANTNLTIDVFNKFLNSKASHFIFMSSIKSVIDSSKNLIHEKITADPKSDYGKTKLLAEEHILKTKIPKSKKVFIIRPCMVHGPNNKGNLNLLFKIVTKGVPWPLGKFHGRRSFCSIFNLCYVLKQLIINKNINSGIYNVCDDQFLTTNEIVKLIGHVQEIKTRIFKAPVFLIKIIAKIGDFINLPINSIRLNKLTAEFMVSNKKIKDAIGIKEMPITAKEGLIKTFNSFSKTQ